MKKKCTPVVNRPLHFSSLFYKKVKKKCIKCKKGNLMRWGIKIDGIRVPFKKLSSDFVDYHISFGIKTEYWN